METKISFWKYKGPLERVKTKILTKLIIRQSENKKKSFRIFFYKKSERENGQTLKSFRWNTYIHLQNINFKHTQRGKSIIE